MSSQMDYPPAYRSDHIDVYRSRSQGEVKIYDPYNWLEKPSTETDDWIDAQVSLSRAYLDGIPHREDLENDFTRNMNYAKFSAPKRKGDSRWYWYHNTGLQQQSVLYRSLDGTLTSISDPKNFRGEVFFDPNNLTHDGTGSIVVASFSTCGKYWACGLSLSGSDFCTVYVHSTDHPVRSPVDAPLITGAGANIDVVRYVKFSDLSWTHDSKGFFYQRFPARDHGSVNDDIAGTETEMDLNAMLYYHRVGTSQDDDILVIKDPENPNFLWGTSVSEVDGRYLVLTIRRDTSRRNKVWICDLSTSTIGTSMEWIKAIDGFEAAYNFVHNEGTRLFFRTNHNAPYYKVVTIDISNQAAKPVGFISEDTNAPLENIAVINRTNFVAIYRRDVKDELHLLSSKGKKICRLTESFVGSIHLGIERSRDPYFFATMSGFTTPGLIARFDFKEPGASDIEMSYWHVPSLPGLDLDEFVTEQRWYDSKDGTSVPMFIVRHTETALDGTAPAILYGYGGFSISVAPSFNSSTLTFLKNYGGVYVVANIRGGGEYGEDWHQAGIRERKVNCFDDFISAAEYLVRTKIAAPGKVAINGGSNGGKHTTTHNTSSSLLVAACINRAPSGTFGAAVAQVGVLDMLKFDEFTIGRAWVSDYGNPKEDTDFDFILPISPLHNVPADRNLPPTLLQTADHDDRVVPLHSFKYAATLQHEQANNPNPLLVSIDRKAGHGAGKSTILRIKEHTDKFAFIANAMNLDWKRG